MASSRGFSLKEILAKLRSASRTRPSHEPKQLFPQPDGYEPISLSVAGIMYEDRAQQVRQCVLREPVWLVRDRDNVHDVHAIRVLNRNDEMLGFVGRHMTPHLAEYVDTSDNPVQAVITELMSDVAGSVIAAKIGLFVPASVSSKLRSETRQLGYSLDSGSAGSIYFLLDCDESRLHEITSRLIDSGYPWSRFGISHRPASDGHQYPWYILLDDSVTTEDMEQFIRENADVFPAPEPPEPSLDDWIEYFDAENTDLSTQVSHLKSRVAVLEEKIRSTNARSPETETQVRQIERKLRSQWKEEVRQLVQILLPSVEFLRDSLDVATIEYASYLNVLRAISVLVHDPLNVRGERVESANGWKEIHCSTGQKNDGRIYFKLDNSVWLVLISFKQSQKKDMEYLKRC